MRWHVLTYIAQDIQTEQQKAREYWCTNRAPHLFFIKSGYCYIVQGCCNSWTCPRCGNIRAKQEFHKMIYGAEKLAEMGHDLYFLTLTCRGADMPLATAEHDYYKWTTRLLNACRNELRRRDGFWAYCQVTERQKRLHPHSHLITTYLPKNSVRRIRIDKRGAVVEYFESDWFRQRNISAGLGPQYDITQIRSAKGVASYVAKYLFKSAMQTEWPKNWRRIRYSRSWPRSQKEPVDDGWPLLNKVDWARVVDLHVAVHTDSLHVYTDAKSNRLDSIMLHDTLKLTEAS